MGQQGAETRRHVGIERGRDIPQVPRRVLDQARHGPARVDVERAAIGQHHVEHVVAAEGMVPRQPVDQHRRLVGVEQPALPRLLLVGAEHALRVDHPLGHAGRARGEEILGHRVRADGGEGQVHRIGVAFAVAEQIVETVSRDAIWRIGGRHHVDPVERQRVQHRREGSAVFDIDHAGPYQGHDVMHLGEVLAHQGIGRRYRGHGNAHLRGRQHQQSMAHGVGGEDHQRPLRPQTAAQQGGREPVGHRPSLGIAHAIPVLAAPFGQEGALWRRLRPMAQPRPELWRIVFQRLRRSQDHASVRPLLDGDGGFGKARNGDGFDTHGRSSDAGRRKGRLHPRADRRSSRQRGDSAGDERLRRLRTGER